MFRMHFHCAYLCPQKALRLQHVNTGLNMLYSSARSSTHAYFGREVPILCPLINTALGDSQYAAMNSGFIASRRSRAHRNVPI